MPGEELVVALGADERFAVGLAVAGRSVLDHRPPAVGTHLVVFDRGLTEPTWERLLASWPGASVERIALEPGVALKHRLGTLLADHRRAVYVDADMLVRGDLGGLPWPEPGELLSGVQDTMIPFLRDDLDAEAFGRRGDQPYFNSGLLVLALDAWRREGIDEQAQAIQERYGDELWSTDQQALNVAVAGRWRPLPLRWNRMTHVGAVPDRFTLCFPADEVAEAWTDPAVVHFAGHDKPWRGSSPDPLATEWFATLDETAWSGWRPAPAAAASGIWSTAVHRAHRRIDFARRGARLARREAAPVGPWARSAAALVARRPWLAATYPLSRARQRLRGLW